MLHLSACIGQQNGLISKARLRSLRYLIYTALGLPFTIYLAANLAANLNYNAISLLRFVMVITFLINNSHKNASRQHIFLFCCGFLIYVSAQQYDLSNPILWTTPIIYTTAALLVSLREKYALAERKKLSQLRLDLGRSDRKLRRSELQKLEKREAEQQQQPKDKYS